MCLQYVSTSRHSELQFQDTIKKLFQCFLQFSGAKYCVVATSTRKIREKQRFYRYLSSEKPNRYTEFLFLILHFGRTKTVRSSTDVFNVEINIDTTVPLELLTYRTYYEYFHEISEGIFQHINPLFLLNNYVRELRSRL